MKCTNMFYLALAFAVTLVISSEAFSQEIKEKESEGSTLSLAEVIEIKPRLIAYLKVRQLKMTGLAAKYGKVIDARLNKAADAGDLKTAEAFQEEKESLGALGKAFGAELKDPAKGVRERGFLPELAAGAPEALVSLRKIWTTELQKIRSSLDLGLQQSLKKLETDLTKARNFKNAKQVLIYRELLLSESPVATEAAVSSKGTPARAPVMEKGSLAISSATMEQPFENSLKMRFVPVPIIGGPTDGRIVLFSIWETRVEDYEKFIKKNRQIQWQKVTFKQKGDHPAVNVSWDNAVTFCEWLTTEERKKGKIGKTDVYRLPTDHEWSCAVGLGESEDASVSPLIKSIQTKSDYPWGVGMPPKKGAGNYYGEETKRNPTIPVAGQPLEGYSDDFPQTAPVGSFNANKFGLFDMSGNAYEWCQDWHDSQKKDRRVLRGMCWIGHPNYAEALRFSYRASQNPNTQFRSSGVRIVLERGAGGVNVGNE